MTATSSLLLALLIGCQDEPQSADTGQPADSEESSEEMAASMDCELSAMVGAWSGNHSGNETLPQEMTIDGSGMIGDIVGETLITADYYVEGSSCRFSMSCLGADEAGNVAVWAALVEETVSEGTCGDGEYRLSLMTEDTLLVQLYIDSVYYDEWTLSR